MTKILNDFYSRIFRSPYAPYLKDELLEEEDFYPEDFLRDLLSHGFNGIWLRGVLRNLVKSTIFPEFGKHSEKRLKKLNHLIERCGRLGIGVYFYFDEPLCFAADDPFWKRHPQVRGEAGSSIMDNLSNTYAMCTSVQETKDFLYESTQRLFREAPGLKGAFLITASEHHSHCYSHVNLRLQKGHSDKATRISCPRCGQRTPAEVIAEIMFLVNRGAKSVDPEAEIIAWNWSWSMYEKAPYADIISKLPSDVILMIDFERGGKKEIRIDERVEKEVEIDEYSLSYIGPSEGFQNSLKQAKKKNMICYTKVQLGTTLEMATVPNLPLIPNIYRKLKRLKESGVKGFLGGWSFGNFLTLSTFVVSRLSGKNFPEDEDSFLQDIAIDYFRDCDSKKVTMAWKKFCESFDFYPFSMAFLYRGPIIYAPVYSWRFEYFDKPMEFWPSCYFRGIQPKGDRLEDCLGPFTLEEVTTLLEKMVIVWKEGLDILIQGLKPLNQHSIEELSTAKMIYHQLRSIYNIFRFHQYRQCYLDNKKEDYRRLLLSVVEDEIKNLSTCLDLVKQDSRLGFYAETQSHFYNAETINDSIKRLLLLKDKLLRC